MYVYRIFYSLEDSSISADDILMSIKALIYSVMTYYRLYEELFQS